MVSMIFLKSCYSWRKESLWFLLAANLLFQEQRLMRKVFGSFALPPGRCEPFPGLLGLLFTHRSIEFYLLHILKSR